MSLCHNDHHNPNFLLYTASKIALQEEESSVMQGSSLPTNCCQNSKTLIAEELAKHICLSELVSGDKDVPFYCLC